MNATRLLVPCVLLSVFAACAVGGDDAPGPEDPDLALQGKKPKPTADAGTTPTTDAGTTDAGTTTTDAGATTTDAGATSGGGASQTGSFVDACRLPGAKSVTFSPTGSIAAADEGVSAPIVLPFPFTILGTTHSAFWVTTNGELGLGQTPGGHPFGQVTCPLPGSKLASPIVFAYTTDLRLNLPGGAVCVATTGTAPNRKVVVTWKDLAFYELANGGDSHVTFGATLSEGTNAIDVTVHKVDVYSPSLPPAYFTQGAAAVLGLQASAGARAVPFSCQEPKAPPGSTFRHAP